MLATFAAVLTGCLFGCAPKPTAEQSPAPMRLWANRAPGALGDEPADVPTLTRFDPPAGKATGAAFVVCPGGGYGGLAPHEGPMVGQWLSTLGVTGFVLKYRLAPRYHHPSMMQDVNRAIRYVRYHAKEWGIDPQRIGILGFSAGGHLASTAATHFDGGIANASDPVDRVSSRPDAAVLCYPVITMDPAHTHMGSRINLIGQDPAPALAELMSNEKQVTAKTPPTFIFHTADDGAVPVENALLFAEALQRNKVPFELHIYAHGPHGVGLAQNDPVLGTWPSRLADWLKGIGFTR